MEKVRDNILKGVVVFKPEDVWGEVTEGAKKFIRDLLRVEPELRPTAIEAQNHNWITTSSTSTTPLHGPVLSTKTVENLVTFKSYSNMRKLICEIISFTLMPEQIKGLRKEFEKADEEGKGEIGLEGLKKILRNSASEGKMGALEEEEVTAIFENLKMSKQQKNVHYHEFIAACLSQCEIDERNLRLAFERMDNERKGYITVENVQDLMGCDATEETVLEMFKEAKSRLRSSSKDEITFSDFVKLMKGQDEGNRVSPMVGSINSRSKSRSGEGGLADGDDAGGALAIKVEALDDSFYLDAPATESERLAAPMDIGKTKRRTKSKSFDETCSVHSLERIRQDSNASPVLHLGRVFRRARENSLENDEGDPIQSPEVTPLKESRRIYRSHREMRIAIFEASRRFEEKTQSKRDKGGYKPNVLTIKKTQTPPRQGFLTTIPGSADSGEKQQKDELLELPRKGSRERKKRIRVMSDVTGLGVEPIS